MGLITVDKGQNTGGQRRGLWTKMKRFVVRILTATAGFEPHSRGNGN